MSRPASHVVAANGVRLHYLDWGGEGRTVVFLAGSGNTPHFFDSVARRIAGGFRVLGLTRRGHGESEEPDAGYDIATLARDVAGFLDGLGIETASFAGHSFAGSEMVELATKHGKRVDKLIFLDALYEYEQGDLDLFASNPLRASTPPPKTFESPEAYSRDFVQRYPQYRRLRSPRWDALLAHALEPTPDGRYRERPHPSAAQELGRAHFSYHGDWRAMECPVLAVFAFQDPDWPLPEGAPPALREAIRAYGERVDRELKQRCIARAQREIAHLRLLRLDGASHYCFLDREDDIVEAMLEFLRCPDFPAARRGC